jgi:DNA-binding response OmpR family regulator
MRVLVAEDSRPMAEALAKGLREQGYAVDIAFDGETALMQASKNGRKEIAELLKAHGAK